MRSFEDGAERPFIHLVDGGVSDNLGLRGIIDAFEQIELSAGFQRALRIDQLRRIAIFVVNSLSDPATDWDRHERPPNDVPTSFVLPPEAVDRLRAAAGELIRPAPDFQRLVGDISQAKPPQPMAPPIHIR